MTTVTLNADETLVEEAHRLARQRNTTLDALFAEWLAELADRRARAHDFVSLTDRFAGKIRFGRKLSREELND